MPTKEDLQYLQALPLEAKVLMTKARIREWISHYGTSGVYVSFSGGKDSTVLLHLVREEWPDVEAVFVNTGLEYPEIQSFAKQFDNVTVLTPKMAFPEVIKTYGYPIISKDVSQCVSGARKSIEIGSGKSQYRIKRLNGELLDKNGRKSMYNVEKYKPLLYVDFKFSHKCCDVMKKGPAKIYEKENNKVPFIATMACESIIRKSRWFRESCNAFENKRPHSNPMSFWTENDVLQYIKENDLKIASVYGEVVPKGGQLAFEGCTDCDKFETTGCYRTGCIFCGFGAHLDKNPRFVRLKETHPKQYNYCIGGGRI